MPLLTEALADKDWAVRVRAAALLKELDPVERCANADPAGADDACARVYARRGFDHARCLDAGLHRHRSRDDSDGAGGAGCAR